jgi:hypothetical protein
VLLEECPELMEVGEVAVVREGDISKAVTNAEGLEPLELGLAACSRVPRVPNLSVEGVCASPSRQRDCCKCFSLPLPPSLSLSLSLPLSLSLLCFFLFLYLSLSLSLSLSLYRFLSLSLSVLFLSLPLILSLGASRVPGQDRRPGCRERRKNRRRRRKEKEEEEEEEEEEGQGSIFTHRTRAGKSLDILGRKDVRHEPETPVHVKSRLCPVVKVLPRHLSDCHGQAPYPWLWRETARWVWHEGDKTGHGSAA